MALDGHMATAAIRSMEDEDGQGKAFSRTPIIALTAHAIRGYKEKCLAAGMDDFMTKPLRKKELYAMVEKWTWPLPELPVEKAFYPELLSPVDMDMIREIWEEDDLIRDALSDFLKELDPLLASVADAVNNRDQDRLAESAHRFKGALLYAGAKPASDIAYALEALGKSKDLSPAADLLISLEKSCEEIRQLFIKDIL